MKTWKEKDEKKEFDRKDKLKYPEKYCGDAIRGRKLKCVYGMTIIDWDNMVEEQGDECACCHMSSADVAINSILCMDHDHNYDKNDPEARRAIVCRECNWHVLTREIEDKFINGGTPVTKKEILAFEFFYKYGKRERIEPPTLEKFFIEKVV